MIGGRLEIMKRRVEGDGSVWDFGNGGVEEWLRGKISQG
jgi:hypothetical protein